MSIFDEIEAIIGAPAVAALKTEFGGKRLNIPKKINENHPIAAVVGLDKAKLIAENFHTQTIEMPVALAKKTRILADLKKGDTPSAISQRYFVTRQFVMKLNAQMKRSALKDLQQDLF